MAPRACAWRRFSEQLRRTDALGVGLFAVFGDIHTKVLSLFRHAELNTKTPQNTSDQEGTDRSQAIGHQHGLQLTQNQGTAALFRQNLTGRVRGDQLSVGKDTRQQGAGGPPTPWTA